MITLLLVFGGVLFLAFGYLPLVLVVLHRDKTKVAHRRPANEVLRDALAEGRISQSQFETMIDEIHAAMPSLDAPYPKVREWKEFKR